MIVTNKKGSSNSRIGTDDECVSFAESDYSRHSSHLRMNSQRPSLALEMFFVFACFRLFATGAYCAEGLRIFSAQHQQSALLATINVSGSTNTLPYVLAVYDNGSAVLDVQDKPQRQFPAGTADSQRLEILLVQVGDVSRLRGGRCARSVSFGTITQITYNGKTSDDISCTAKTAWPRAGYDLSAFVNDLKLRLNIQSAIGRQR